MEWWFSMNSMPEAALQPLRAVPAAAQAPPPPPLPQPPAAARPLAARSPR